MTNNKHNLNYYVKNPEARFFIRAIAYMGYIALGLIWWILFIVVGFIYRLLQKLTQAMQELLEVVSEFIDCLEELHKTMSYSEMLLHVVGVITALTLGILALYAFAVALVLMPI